MRLLDKEGAPHARLNTVRVVGSKGKGTTTRILAAILHSAGYHVGVFSSPHIEHWCERIRVGERDIPVSRLASTLARLAPMVDGLRADPTVAGPDLFEVLLVAALSIFQANRVDLAIVEAGIGGRGDATNCLGPMLSIVTTIEGEHLDIIGPTVADVAREKTSIAAPGVPFVSGRMAPEIGSIVDSITSAKGARLVLADRDFEFTVERTKLGVTGRYSERDYAIHLPLTDPLARLSDCVALALAAARRLPGFTISDSDLRQGLVEVALPGRMETLQTEPLILTDGAHTAASTGRLACMLAGFHDQPYRKNPKILVVSCSTGHDPGDWSHRLWSVVDAVITTCAEPSRSHDARDTARRIAAIGPSIAGIQPDPTRALGAAMKRAGSNGLVCATGSVYMVACAKRFARAQNTS